MRRSFGRQPFKHVTLNAFAMVQTLAPFPDTPITHLPTGLRHPRSLFIEGLSHHKIIFDKHDIRCGVRSLKKVMSGPGVTSKNPYIMAVDLVRRINDRLPTPSFVRMHVRTITCKILPGCWQFFSM